MKPHTVLVVDDSKTMRALITAALSRDPQLSVVGEAADPLEARELVKRLNPDVITLDIEMPKMNGLDFLERLMRLRPTPVIVISTLTQRGAEATIRALELGAVDCIAKPSARNPQAMDQLVEAVKTAAKARPQKRDGWNSVSRPSSSETAEEYCANNRIVAIGASMGGVEALAVVLSSFPENCPPTVITQHMPALFTRSFAERLDRQFKPQVCEATDGAALAPGRVFIAPGGDAHLEVVGPTPRCRLRKGDLVSGHRPSIDALFSSLAQTFPQRSIGVILTGMGRDGARGLQALRSAGAETIGQDEATSIVYGMPRAAFELGAVAQQLPLGAIAERVLQMSNALKSRV